MYETPLMSNFHNSTFECEKGLKIAFEMFFKKCEGIYADAQRSL